MRSDFVEQTSLFKRMLVSRQKLSVYQISVWQCGICPSLCYANTQILGSLTWGSLNNQNQSLQGVCLQALASEHLTRDSTTSVKLRIIVPTRSKLRQMERCLDWQHTDFHRGRWFSAATPPLDKSRLSFWTCFDGPSRSDMISNVFDLPKLRIGSSFQSSSSIVNSSLQAHEATPIANVTHCQCHPS